jgi:hypothetical protein
MNPVDATPAPASAARPRLDRFLIGILVGLVLLLIFAGLAVFLRQPPPELPADSPGGTVQRFYNAILKKDYDAAYLLLSDSMTDKPAHDRFVQHNATQASYNSGQQNDRIRLTTDTVTGDTAVVTANITHFYNNSNPFGGSNEWTETNTFTLRNEDGTWRITVLPYAYIPY